MAAPKKKTTRSANPGQMRIPGGKKPAAKRTNGRAPAKRTKSRRSSGPRRPNPTSSNVVNLLLAAGAGVVSVITFDELMNRFAPASVSGFIRVLAKGAAGYAIGFTFVGKFLGSWAPIVMGALWFSALYDVWNGYGKSYFAGYLTPSSSVASTAPLVDQNTGQQLGTRLNLTNGDTYDVWSQDIQNVEAYA